MLWFDLLSDSDCRRMLDRIAFSPVARLNEFARQMHPIQHDENKNKPNKALLPTVNRLRLHT